ncbi:MAG: hypothetical protein SGPRY_001348, partial [Prymnesium sp.]
VWGGVELKDMSKLVFVANTRGPAAEGALSMERFRAANFPANLAGDWEERFGYIPKKLRVPLGAFARI